MSAQAISQSAAVGYRSRSASSSSALVLAGVVVVLAIASVPLAILAGHLEAAIFGALPVVAVAFTAVGFIILRRDSRHPVGWMLLAVGALMILLADAGLYSVLDYRVDGGSLPFGRVAVFWVDTMGTAMFVVLPMVILLFPDGRSPSRRWRWSLWAYLAMAAVYMAGVCATELSTSYGRHIAVGLDGSFSGVAHISATATTLSNVGTALLPFQFLIMLAWVIRQFVSFRRSTGERRQQLKWLSFGSAICLVAIYGVIKAGGESPATADVALAVSFLGVAALPISIGIAILKYRLYEIDRIVSRTLSYAILTALLVGTFVALVALTTDLLSFSSSVGVAASTLAAAALFNPLRKRVQRIVDGRFNRARYDAEETVTAFAARLRDAVDIDTIQDELLYVVQQAVEPSHATIWVRPPGPTVHGTVPR